VGRGLRGRDELAWRERLLGDLDNLRSAVVWGLDTSAEEDQQTAVAIVAWLAYEAQTLATGIGRWAEQALPAAQRSTPGYRSAVLGAGATAAFYRGDFDASERYARGALEEGYPLDDPSPCLASIYLALILGYQGRNDDAARRHPGPETKGAAVTAWRAALTSAQKLNDATESDWCRLAGVYEGLRNALAALKGRQDPEVQDMAAKLRRRLL
jgi:hypothetical protein